MVNKFGFGFGMNDFKTWKVSIPAVAKKNKIDLSVIGPRYVLVKEYSVQRAPCEVK